MRIFVNRLRNKNIYGMVPVMVALALVAALAVAASLAGPGVSAQAPTGPKPCGPNEQAPPENADATVSRGHYAIFDGYWDDDDNVLRPNLCPPSVVHTTRTETDPNTGNKTETVVSTRSASNIDLRRTVIHIDSAFEHELTPADVETYDFFKTGVNTTTSDGNSTTTQDTAVGQTVWWLMADDDEEEETTGGATEPEFHMGFSAALFDPDDWFLKDGTTKGAKPLQYEFEVIREHGVPEGELGHLFAFDESQPPADPATGEVIKTAEWDSSEVDANALALYPGDYYHYQWAFTKPGTYIVSVQLKGHVRTKDNRSASAGVNWKPISDKNVETSEVMQYVFQVGPLTLNEEPIFETMRSVEEDSAIGAPVGDPIPVYQGDDDDLTFTLSGTGHSLFSVEEDANGDAQIEVAGDLDYEVRREYRLTLGVSDNRDHEDNEDEYAEDNRISVKISVTGQVERSVAENSAAGALVGDPIVVAGANASATYALAGNGSDLFAVEPNSDYNAQIEVAAGADLDYETATSYDLTLQVSNGAEQEDIALRISVTDVEERSVAEHSAVGALVGDPIVVAGASTSTMYALAGSGSNLFAVARDSDNNAQISVAGDLDYETTSSYDLTLTVSGGDDIPVRINITDVVERSVAENSAAGAPVGAPIVVSGASASTAYALTGSGSNLFTVARDSDNNAQIAVAANADLDYETTSSYDLTLTVSGGDDIPVRINVTDVTTTTATLTASNRNPTTGQHDSVISLTVRVHNESGLTGLRYIYNGDVIDDSGNITTRHTQREVPDTTVYIGESEEVAVRFYVVIIGNAPGGGTERITSNTVDVTWSAPTRN